MPARRWLPFAVLLYVALDLSVPWVPGVFVFDDGEPFLATVVDDKTRVKPLAPVRPRPVPDRAPLPVTASAVTAPPPMAPAPLPGEPRVRPSARSALPPSPLDEH